MCFHNADALMHAYGEFLYLQYTDRTTDEDVNTNYTDLGNISTTDLISFAYQIASGMVSSYPDIASLLKWLARQGQSFQLYS